MTTQPRQDDRSENALRHATGLYPKLLTDNKRTGPDALVWVRCDTLTDAQIDLLRSKYKCHPAQPHPVTGIMSIPVHVELKSSSDFTIATKRDMTSESLQDFGRTITIHGVYDKTAKNYTDFDFISVFLAGALTDWVVKSESRVFGPRTGLQKVLLSPEGVAMNARLVRQSDKDLVGSLARAAIGSEMIGKVKFTAEHERRAIENDGPEWAHAFSQTLSPMMGRAVTTNQIPIGKNDLTSAMRYPGSCVYARSNVPSPQRFRRLLVKAILQDILGVTVTGNGGQGSPIAPSSVAIGEIKALCKIADETKAES